MGRQLNESSFEDWKKDLMNDISTPPSLQRIASLAIAINLWTNIPKKEITFDADKEKEYVYKVVEERVFLKLTALSLPRPSEIEVIHVIRPIGLQLFSLYNSRCTEVDEYKDENFINFLDHYENNNPLCWTVNGALDKVTSYNQVINDNCQEVDIIVLFKLACNLCMKEQIHSLWSKLSFEGRESIYEYLNCFSQNYNCHYSVFWCSILTGRTDIFQKMVHTYTFYDSAQSPNENMLLLSIKLGNSIAFKYFWSNLTTDEKNIHILQLFFELAVAKTYSEDLFFNHQSHDGCYDISSFLFLQLDLPKQKHVLEIESFFILQTFSFYFPNQKYFLKLVSVMMDPFAGSFIHLVMHFALLSEFTAVFEIKIKLLEVVRHICINASEDFKLSFDRYLEYFVVKKMEEMKKNCFGLNEEVEMGDNEEKIDHNEEEMDYALDSVFYIGERLMLENKVICIIINTLSEAYRKNYFVFHMILGLLYIDKNYFYFDEVDAVLSTFHLSYCEKKELKRRVWEEKDSVCQNSSFSVKNSKLKALFCWCFF